MIPRLVLVLTQNWTMFPGALPREMLATVARWARQAEAAGFDAVMISEQSVLGLHPDEASGMPRPREAASTFSSKPEPQTWPSSLVQLATVAACTDRIRLVASAMVSPMHHPLLLAKDFATLDQLSGGRLVVQPTVSHHQDEYASLGVPFQERFDRLDENLDIWEATWKACAAGSNVSYQGRFHSFDDVPMSPGPTRESGPPLWLGEQSLHPALIRRLVRYGAGYNALGSPTSTSLVQLADAMDAAGRPGSSMELIGHVEGSNGRDDPSHGDLGRALESVPRQMAQGFGTFCIKPSQFIDDPNAVGDFCREVVIRLARLLRQQV